MGSPNRPGTEAIEDLKREIDAHVQDDEAHPDERMPADRFLANLRKQFQPIDPK